LPGIRFAIGQLVFQFAWLLYPSPRADELVIFLNRAEAGRRLAQRLEKYAQRRDVIVLGVPRGGVPVAFEIAQALRVPLDVLVLRKLGVPSHEELALGAIAFGGVRVLDDHILRALHISAEEVEAITERERRELVRREIAYRANLPPLDIAQKTLILVDYGVATGASMLAGIRAARQRGPAGIVVAIPVAPLESCERLADQADEVVCIETPEPFGAVGQFYGDFSEVSDQEVIRLLRLQNKNQRTCRHGRSASIGAFRPSSNTPRDKAAVIRKPPTKPSSY
jgi:predicted phosphoribosyltransferase